MTENVNGLEATTPEPILGQVAEGTSPEPSLEPEIKQPTPEEVALQRERSGIGRRLSAVERELKDKMSGIETTLNQIKSFIQTPGQPQNDDEFVPQTIGDLNQIIDKRADLRISHKQTQVEKAQTEFMKTLVRISIGDGDTEEEFDEIRKEIVENYHQGLSDRPDKDAETIYYRAKYALEKRKTATVNSGKISPLRGEKPKAPLGGTQANKMTPPKVTETLSPRAKMIMKTFGVPDE